MAQGSSQPFLVQNSKVILIEPSSLPTNQESTTIFQQNTFKPSQQLTPIIKKLQILVVFPKPPKIQPRTSPTQSNIVPNQFDFSKDKNISFDCTTIKNNLTLMAMIKKMKKEQLVARFIQHGSKSYLICSKVSRIS